MGGETLFGIIRGMPAYDISSTDIREALRSGRNADKVLDRNVMEYIKTRSLYEH